MTPPQLDAVIHQRTRLVIMAALTEVDSASFTHLRDTLGLSDGNLARHLTTLSDTGYIAVTKVSDDRTTWTEISATDDGRAAFVRYLDDLDEIIRVARATTSAPSSSPDHDLEPTTSPRRKRTRT